MKSHHRHASHEDVQMRISTSSLTRWIRLRSTALRRMRLQRQTFELRLQLVEKMLWNLPRHQMSLSLRLTSGIWASVYATRAPQKESMSLCGGRMAGGRGSPIINHIEPALRIHPAVLDLPLRKTSHHLIPESASNTWTIPPLTAGLSLAVSRSLCAPHWVISLWPFTLRLSFTMRKPGGASLCKSGSFYFCLNRYWRRKSPWPTGIREKTSIIQWRVHLCSACTAKEKSL
jgi:hypothetical protein